MPKGRLVLADAVTYVQRNYKPATIIDLATLTGAILISLGHEWAGLFSNNDELAAQAAAGGRGIGRQAVADAARRAVRPADRFADRRHEERRPARRRLDHRRAVHPALHRQRRRAGPTSTWPARPGRTRPSATYDKGATGFGVRLLDQYVADVLER